MKIDKIITMLLELIEESEGCYLTDNKNIMTDDLIIYRNDHSLCIQYDNDNINIPFSEISGLYFDIISNTTMAIIKSKNRKNLLIHIL